MTAPLHDRLEREPTDAAPGRHESNDLTLAWDLQALTVTRPGHEPHSVPFDGCALQLSRAQLEPRPRGWRRLLGFASSPVAHLVVELRPRVGPRTQLTAAAPEAMLAGLPRLQPGHGHHAVALDGLLALVDAARAGGASLVHGPAEADTPGATAPALRFGARAGLWPGLLLALAAVGLALALSLPYALSELERWVGERLVEAWAPLVACAAPTPVLALTLWRTRERLWRRQGLRPLVVALVIALVIALFFTAVMAANAFFDGSERGSTIDLLDTTPNRLEYCLGLVLFHVGSFAALTRLRAWQALRLDAHGVTLRRWGLWRRFVPWSDADAVRDALLAPAARHVQRGEALELALRIAAEPASAVRRLEVHGEGSEDAAGSSARWLGRTTHRWPSAVALWAVAASLALSAADAEADRRVVFVLAPTLVVLGAWRALQRSRLAVDPALGVVVLRRQPGGREIDGPLFAPRAGAWLVGGSARHVEGVRPYALGNVAQLMVVPQAGSPLSERRAFGAVTSSSVSQDDATAIAAELVASMSAYGWQVIETRSPRPGAKQAPTDS